MNLEDVEVLNLLNGLSRVTSCASSSTSGSGWNPNQKYWKKNRKWLRKNSTFILRNFSHFKIIWNLGGKFHAFKKKYDNKPEIISWIWRPAKSESSEWPFTSHILFFFQYFRFRFELARQSFSSACHQVILKSINDVLIKIGNLFAIERVFFYAGTKLFSI